MLAKEALAGPRHAFEIAFDVTGESTRPVRGAPWIGNPAWRVELAGERPSVEDEAMAVARAIQNLIGGANPAHVRNDDQSWRDAGYGDVAILLPRMTQVHTFVRALEAHGIPHVVAGGRGLLSTVEARDLLSLARVLMDRGGALDLLAVLRGPWVGLSDDSLEVCAKFLGPARSGDDSVLARFFAADLEGVATARDASERERLRAARGWLRRLHAATPRLGLSRALSNAIDATHLKAVLAGLTDGGKRVANGEHMLRMIVAREGQGDLPPEVLGAARATGAGGSRAAGGTAQAAADAVRLMTIHQAKGLQFPS